MMPVFPRRMEPMRAEPPGWWGVTGWGLLQPDGLLRFPGGRPGGQAFTRYGPPDLGDLVGGDANASSATVGHGGEGWESPMDGQALCMDSGIPLPRNSRGVSLGELDSKLRRVLAVPGGLDGERERSRGGSGRALRGCRRPEGRSPPQEPTDPSREGDTPPGSLPSNLRGSSDLGRIGQGMSGEIEGLSRPAVHRNPGTCLSPGAPHMLSRAESSRGPACAVG
jgi:hypothetical protein